MLLAGVLLVAGCAATPQPSLSVVLEQSRDNENRHLLQVVLTDEGPEPVDVVRLQLRSPAFSGVAPTVREDVLAPGRRLAFPIGYGVADCRGRGPATVVVGYRAGGSLREVAVPVPADDPLLARLQDRECRLGELSRAASLSFAPGWSRRGAVASGELVVARRSGAVPVTVTAVDGSVLFTLRAAAALPVALGPGGQVRLPVTAQPTRCDPHALAESKRTYDFTLAVALGTQRPVSVTVRPEPADVALLTRLLLDTCRQSGGPTGPPVRSAGGRAGAG